MGSYAELYQQQQAFAAVTSLQPADGRAGYAQLYAQRADQAQRSDVAPQHGADEDVESTLPSGRQLGSPAPSASSPRGTLTVEAGMSSGRSPGGHASAVSPGRSQGPGSSPYTSPTRRPYPSISRPATTVLAQATALRSAKLKQLAQRQQQVRSAVPAAGQATRSVATMQGRPQVALSSVLQSAPHLYDRQRLSAVERFVTVIDRLPARFADAQVVYLSKNSLTSLSGLEQFGSLRVLGLADNLLADMEQVEQLSSICPGLEALSLEGNPLAYIPNYRSRVLLALPGLRSLDGRPVGDGERAAAPAAVTAEEAVMTVLLRNACEVHKMAGVIARCQLHMELMHVMHGGGAVLRRVEAMADVAAAGAGGGGRSLVRLVEMWDYEGSLSPQERRKIMGALQREVGRMYRGMRAQQREQQGGGGGGGGPTWEDAFAKVLAAQQQTTAALLDLLGQCQVAMGELVGSFAPTATAESEGGPPAVPGGTPQRLRSATAAAASGRGSGAGRGGGAGVRALLRDAEADVERQRELRREREELVLELRDETLSARGSPLRAPRSPAPRTGPLKSALKKPTVQLLGPSASSSAEPRVPQPPPSGLLPWQSARSTPVSPEAVERLMRARRSVVPGSRGPRIPGSIAERETSAEREDGAAGSGVRAESAAGVRGAGQVRSRSADTMRGRRAPATAEAVAAGLDRSGRSASAPRRRHKHEGPPGGSKASWSPQLQQPVWRPSGTAGPRSAPSSPDYKDAAQAAARAMRARYPRQTTTATVMTHAGLAPEHLAGEAPRLGTTGAGMPAAANPARASAASLPHAQQQGLPMRVFAPDPSASPTLSTRSNAPLPYDNSVPLRHSMPDPLWHPPPTAPYPQQAGSTLAVVGPLRGSEPSGVQPLEPPLRRSLPTGMEAGVYMPDGSLQPVSAAQPGVGLLPGRTSPRPTHGSRQAAVSAGSSSSGAAARLEELRRQVEQSVAETAQLRATAQAALRPLPWPAGVPAQQPGPGWQGSSGPEANPLLVQASTEDEWRAWRQRQDAAEGLGVPGGRSSDFAPAVEASSPLPQPHALPAMLQPHRSSSSSRPSSAGGYGTQGSFHFAAPDAGGVAESRRLAAFGSVVVPQSGMGGIPSPGPAGAGEGTHPPSISQHPSSGSGSGAGPFTAGDAFDVRSTQMAAQQQPEDLGGEGFGPGDPGGRFGTASTRPVEEPAAEPSLLYDDGAEVASAGEAAREGVMLTPAIGLAGGPSYEATTPAFRFSGTAGGAGGVGGTLAAPGGGPVLTPGGTVLSLVDSGGGSTRLEVQEMVQEDSAGFKDQHIHVHIHPLQPGAPNAPEAVAATPALFLGTDRQQPGTALPPSPAGRPAAASAAAEPATSMSSLIAPGSPLHEELAAGRLVYEKIERIKPAARHGAGKVPRVSPSKLASPAGRRSRRSGATSTAGGSEAGGMDGGARDVNAGRSYRGRMEQPGFGYGSDGGGSGSDVEGGGKSSGGDEDEGHDDVGHSGDGERVRHVGSARQPSSSSGDSRSEQSRDASSKGSHSGRAPQAGGPRGQARGGRFGSEGDHEQGDGEDGLPRRQQRRREPSRPATPGGRRVHSRSRQGDQGQSRDQGRRGSAAEAAPEANQGPVHDQHYLALQQQLAEQARVSSALAEHLQLLQQRTLQQQQAPLHQPHQQPHSPAASDATFPGAMPPLPAGVAQLRSYDSAGSGSQSGAPSLARERTQLPVPRSAGGAAAVPMYQLPAEQGPRGTPNQRASLEGVGFERAGASTPTNAGVVGPSAAAAASAGSFGSTVELATDTMLPTPVSPPYSTLLVSPIKSHPQAAGQPGPRSPQGQPTRQQQQQEEYGLPRDLPPHVRQVAAQIQEQAAHNQLLQQQIEALDQQLAAAAVVAQQPHSPAVEAALEGLAATSNPLPGGTLRSLEQQLVAVTLEKEAVERALLGEQAEVRLLQQELGMLSHVADALDQAQGQLQELRLVVSHQQHEVQERDAQLAAATERTKGLEQELQQEKEQATAQLADQTNRHTEELQAKQAAAAEAAQQVAEAHRNEVAALKAGHESAVAQLQAERESALASVKEQCAQQLADREVAAQREADEREERHAEALAEQVRKVEELQRRCEQEAEEHARQLQEAEAVRQRQAAAHEEVLRFVREENERREREGRAAHAADMQQLRDVHGRELGELAGRLQETLDRHVRQLDELTEDHRAALDELERRAARELTEQRADAEARLAAAEERHGRVVEAVRSEMQEQAEVAERRLERVERAAEAEAERAAQLRERLQEQLDEALVALGNERMEHGVLRERHAELEAREAKLRAQWEAMHSRLRAEKERDARAEALGDSALQRRVLLRWCIAACASRHASRRLAGALAARRAAACRAALHRWHLVLLRTRLLRGMVQARGMRTAGRALACLQAYVLHRRSKRRAASIAQAHRALRLQARCFVAWLRLHRAHGRAAQHADPDQMELAAAAHRRSALAANLTAWRQHVYNTRMPQVRQRRRAARAYHRWLQRRALAALAQHVARQAHTRTQEARSMRRRRICLLGKAMACWLRYVDAARHKRAMRAAAEVQWAHGVMARWRRAAARSRAIKRGVEAMGASSNTRRLRGALSRWRAFVLLRRQRAVAERMAAEHRRAALLGRCVGAWLALVQAAAARALHERGMHAYQRMVQVALRWQRMVALCRRQRAVVDRAVRLYRHRVLAATQRAVLTAWAGLVERRRAAMRTTALCFVHGYWAVRARRLLAAWRGLAHAGAQARRRQASEALRGQLEASEASLRQAYAQLQAAHRQCEQLQAQLDKDQAALEVLREELAVCERQLLATQEALEAAEKAKEASARDVAVSEVEIEQLKMQREELQQQAKALKQQVAAGEVSVASLHEQAAALQRTLAQAQAVAREQALQANQQAARYEEQLLAAREDAALARRDLDSRQAAVARLEQQLADGEQQLQRVRAGHEAMLTPLRQELRAKDAQIMALTHLQQQQQHGGWVARDPGVGSRGANSSNSRQPAPAAPEPRPGARVGGTEGPLGAETERLRRVADLLPPSRLQQLPPRPQSAGPGSGPTGGTARDGWNGASAAPSATQLQILRPATAGAPPSTTDASSTDNLLLYPEPSPSESSVFSLPLFNPVSEPLASPSPPKHHLQPTLLPTPPTSAAAPAHPVSWTQASTQGAQAAPAPTTAAALALANTVTAVAALTAGGPGLPSRADVLVLQPTAVQQQARQRQAPPTQGQQHEVGGARGVEERGSREWQEEEFQRRRAEILGLAVEPQPVPRPQQPSQERANELTQPAPQLRAVELQQQHSHPPRVLATDYRTSQPMAAQRVQQQQQQQQPLPGHQPPAPAQDISYQSLPYELSTSGTTAAPSTRHPTQGGSTHPAPHSVRASSGGGSHSSYALAGGQWLGPSDSEVDRLRRVGDEMDRRLAQAAQRLVVGGSGPDAMVPSLASWAHREAGTGAEPLAAGSGLPGPDRVSLDGRVGPEASGEGLGSRGELSAVSVGEAVEAASAAGGLGQGGAGRHVRNSEPSGNDARRAPEDQAYHQPSITSLVQQQEHQRQEGQVEEDPESTLLPALTAGIVGTLVQLRESMARSSATSSLFHSQLSSRQAHAPALAGGALPVAPSPAVRLSSARSSYESASGLGVMATPVGRSGSVPNTPGAAAACTPAAREATLRDLLTAPAAAQSSASGALGMAAQLLPPPPPLQRSSSPAVGAGALDLATGRMAGQQQLADRQASASAPGWPPPLPARPGSGVAAIRRSYDSSTADVVGRPPVPNRSASARASSDSV